MWSFIKLGPEDQIEKPKLDEFFNSQSPTTSLVRESIQNSLDAKIKNSTTPVKVRYSFKNIPGTVLSKYVKTYDGETLSNHLSSGDLGKYKMVEFETNSRCLIVEDFNTIGLTGEIDKAAEGDKSHFRGFWWQVGISNKDKASGGSHGVGKTTLTSSSEAYSFWGITKRSDDERKLLIGFSNLPYHHVNGEQYRGYGRYGVRQNDGKCFQPISNENEISDFENDFGVSRNEYGLSVVIPKILNEITAEDICHAVIDDYYMAILNEALVVEIVNSDGNIKILNSENLKAQAATVSGDNKISALIEFASEAVSMRKGSNTNFFDNINVVQRGHKEGIIQRNDFRDNLPLIRDLFSSGKMVGVRLHFKIEPLNEAASKYTCIDVFLKKDDKTQNMKISQYVRNNIIIRSETPNMLSPFSFAMVIADDEEISDYLRLSEEPSHTRWYLNRLNKEKAYKSDWQLRFVKNSIKQFFNILAGIDEDEKKIKGFASDIFWINEPANNGDDDKKSRKSGKDKTKDIKVDPIERRKSLIHIDKDENGKGFKITSVSDFDTIVSENGISLPKQFIIKMAYLVPTKSSFSTYSKFDFDLSDKDSMLIEKSGNLEVIEHKENKLVFNITGNDFGLHISGFDGVRDIKVSCVLKEHDIEEAA